MKRFLLFFSFVIVCGLAKAQNEQPTEQPTEQQQREQKIEALKVAFISRDLNLTPDEAEKFWPVYNQYAHQLKVTIKNNSDVLERDEKVLNLRKSYQGQFIKILGADRSNRLFDAEGRFRQLLIKRLRNHQNRVNHLSPYRN